MKKIIKNFNNLIQRVIFKVENKTNNNSFISNFNKYLISFISLLFIYLFYLLIPLLYDETWLQTKIERKLLNEFVVNISTSADISYRILPAPHFVIRDSKILVNDDQKTKSIAEIKYFKVFLDQGNFFDKDIRILQYADDSTILVSDEASIFQVFSIIETFSNCSGLELNRGKTQAIWMGCWKFRKKTPANHGAYFQIISYKYSEHIFKAINVFMKFPKTGRKKLLNVRTL